MEVTASPPEVTSSVRPALTLTQKRELAARLRGDGTLAAAVTPVTTADERVLPVDPVLVPLLPDGGLRRGQVVGVGGPVGSGARSLAVSMLAAAVAEGSWLAVVGMPDLGWEAVEELGVDLARVVAVSTPTAGAWIDAVAALCGAVDLVLTVEPEGVSAADGRRLIARARERGTTVVTVTSPSVGRRVEPALAASVRLRVGAVRWDPFVGAGRATTRRVEVAVGGRGAAGRGGGTPVWLPGVDGRLGPVEAPTVVRTSTRPGPRRTAARERPGVSPAVAG